MIYKWTTSQLFLRVFLKVLVTNYGSPEFWRTLFSGQKQSPKGVLKIFSKFTGQQPRRSEISIELLCNKHESHTSARVLSCKFVAFLQNNILVQHFCGTASEWSIWVSVPQPFKIKLQRGVILKPNKKQ